jgi:FMN phosphatase YigB (HAD superfamily)
MEMERDEIIRRAERMQKVARERLEAIPAIEDCIAHVTICAEIGLEPVHCAIGTPREKMEAIYKNFKKRAGVRALKSKYGKDGAEAIIAKHTGRHYNLQ